MQARHPATETGTRPGIRASRHAERLPRRRKRTGLRRRHERAESPDHLGPVAL